jgi:hypothetical protein
MWGFFIALACAVIATGSVSVALGAVGLAALLVYLRREDGPWGSSFKWSLLAGIYLMVNSLDYRNSYWSPSPWYNTFHRSSN